MKTRWKQIWADWSAHRGLFTKVIVVVIIPVSILSALSADATNTSLSAYLAVALLILNAALAALALAIVQGAKKLPDARELYYRRVPVVRYGLILINPAIWLAFVPGLIGLYLYFASLNNAVLLTATEGLWLMIGSVVLLLVSFALTFWMAPVLYVVQDTELGPLQALGRSFQLTRKRPAWLALQLVMLGVSLVVIGVIPVLLFGVLASVLQANWLLTVLQVVLGIILLPVAHLWLARIYTELKARA